MANLNFPFVAGLNTRPDSFALPVPALTKALNVDFTELGGLHLRKPYSSIGTSIVGGGSLSNVRRIVKYDKELLCFTKSNLYSWSPGLSGWVDRGEYLATHLAENSRFDNELEQDSGDRAELSGVAVVAWADNESNDAQVAAYDTTTGAVLLSPTDIPRSSAVTGGARVRVVAGSTHFHVFWMDGTSNLYVYHFTPAQVYDASLWTEASVSGGSTNGNYDVRNNAGTSYVVYGASGSASYYFNTVTDTGTVGTPVNHSYTADGAIALDVNTDAARPVFVARCAGTNVQSDRLSVAGAANGMDTNIGTITADDEQLTCAWRTTAESGGEYRCYAFWSQDEDTGSSNFEVSYNYGDDQSPQSPGTEATLILQNGVASHAFDHDGRVYVWTTFSGESQVAGMAEQVGFKASLQNAYYLFDDQGNMHARAAANIAGGFAQTRRHLPSVQQGDDNAYHWLGFRREVIPLEDPNENDGFGKEAYEKRSPLEIALTFDSDKARRTAQLGKTLYVAGGQIMQFDGEGLVEVGWHQAPWYFTTTTGAGALTGDRAYKASYAWRNAKGEVDRSTSAVVGVESPDSDQVNFGGIIAARATKKTGSRGEATVEMWGTKLRPPPNAPFFLLTDIDPTQTSGDNRYLSNDPTQLYVDNAATWVDDMADSTLETKRPNPENGGVLEGISPPAAGIIVANDERVFLADVAGRPNTVFYSKLLVDGEVVQFNDALSVDVPEWGGPIVAMEFLGETLVVFCETAIYALPGVGPNNLGQGPNYGPARQVALNIGADSQEAIGVTANAIIFHSSKGWHSLDRNFAVQYIGAQVHDYDSDTWVAVDVLDGEHQVRCTSTSRILTYDTAAGQWSEWEEASLVDALLFDGKHHIATATDVKEQDADFSGGVTYKMDVETGWIRLNQLMGFARARRWAILGRYKSAHDLRVRVGHDYDENNYVQDVTWTVSPTTVDGPERMRRRFTRQKCSAIRLRITSQAVGTTGAPAGEGLSLNGFDLEVKIKPGLARLPEAQST